MNLDNANTSSPISDFLIQKLLQIFIPVKNESKVDAGEREDAYMTKIWKDPTH